MVSYCLGMVGTVGVVCNCDNRKFAVSKCHMQQGWVRLKECVRWSLSLVLAQARGQAPARVSPRFALSSNTSHARVRELTIPTGWIARVTVLKFLGL